MSSDNNNCSICLENNKIKHTQWNSDGSITQVCMDCSKNPACSNCNENKKIRYNVWNNDGCVIYLCDECFCDVKEQEEKKYEYVHKCTYCDLEKEIRYTNLNLQNDDPIIRLCKECWDFGKNK